MNYINESCKTALFIDLNIKRNLTTTEREQTKRKTKWWSIIELLSDFFPTKLLYGNRNFETPWTVKTGAPGRRCLRNPYCRGGKRLATERLKKKRRRRNRLRTEDTFQHWIEKKSIVTSYITERLGTITDGFRWSPVNRLDEFLFRRCTFMDTNKHSISTINFLKIKFSREVLGKILSK